jgi:hypothetical protein
LSRIEDTIEVKMLQLATRRNIHISNRVESFDADEQNLEKIFEFDKKYPRIVKRVNKNNTYNCHGLVFASRRTNIDDPDEVKKIINEDNYQIIDKKSVLPGDIIIYKKEGDSEHSGIVVGKPEEPFYIPLILSKWGQMGEYIHMANNCPYDFSNVCYYRIIK